MAVIMQATIIFIYFSAVVFSPGFSFVPSSLFSNNNSHERMIKSMTIPSRRQIHLFIRDGSKYNDNDNDNDNDTESNLIDFTALYNLGENYDQEEALKSGIKLTKAIRRSRVDYEEDIKRINDDISRLYELCEYTVLAFSCFESYTTSGELTYRLEDVEKGHGEFNQNLLNACLAKYGIECNDVSYDRYYGRASFSLNLHNDESESNDD